MMRSHAPKNTRRLAILAQDPSFKEDGSIVRAIVEVPAEALLPGPCGYRVNVIDYDASANVIYAQPAMGPGLDDDLDAYASATDEELLSDPGFHAQNAYAIAMRTLARFEFALGRRVPWGCAGHQLHVAPHAFAEPNAFYSREDRSLFFGYFTGSLEGKTVFTCLSHDVVAHETTHAILDGLRPALFEPSSPDQAAFHEAFADVVALLSVFSLRPVLDALLSSDADAGLVSVDLLSFQPLVDSALFRLASEMGEELAGIRGQPLRASAALKPDKELLFQPSYQAEHARGEILVAAVMQAFINVWLRRLERVGTIREGFKDKELVIEEGARAADHLLTMAIRAIDYCPPTELAFSDYLTALITVDAEVVPDDRYGYRQALLDTFAGFGIAPSPNAGPDGAWPRFLKPMMHSRTHFESMLRDREEIFRFIWENRDRFGLDGPGYIEVLSVRPSIRVSPEGFVLKETVAEYLETYSLYSGELRGAKVDVPEELGSWTRVRLFGGGTIVFDEYGQVKYHVAKHVLRSAADRKRQGNRLRYLFEAGRLGDALEPGSRFARLHMQRAAAGTTR